MKTFIFPEEDRNIYETEFYKIESRYPVGTRLHKLFISDPKDRYLQLPWQTEETMWIQIMPLALTEYSTDADLDMKIKFFEDNGCSVSTEISFYVKEPVTKSQLKKMNKKENEFPELLKFVEGYDISICPAIFKFKSFINEEIVPAKTYEIPRNADAIYDFKGVKKILIIDNFNNKIAYHNPSDFTLENPFILSNMPFYYIELEIDNEEGICEMNEIYYISNIRRELGQKATLLI